MSYSQMMDVRAGDFEGEHEWMVPGINCQTCGDTWLRIGAAVPSASLAGHPLEPTLRSPGPLPLAHWRAMAEAIRPRLPPSEPVSPGLSLGKLVGRAVMPFSMGWLQGWGLVLSERVAERMDRAWPQLRLVEAVLPDGAGGRYFEIEIQSHAQLAEPEVLRSCDACGARRMKYPAHSPVITPPPDLPMFRLVGFPTILVVREDLRAFFEEEFGSAAEYRPVTVAG